MVNVIYINIENSKKTYLIIMMTTTTWNRIKYILAAGWVTRENPVAISRMLRKVT